MGRKYWIMKSEPSEFGIDDLASKKTAFWDGVRNYQVRNMFRDDMRVGDLALFYHSNTKEIGVVGEMEILKSAEADPTQFIPGHKYYDAKSKTMEPRWLGPVVGFIKKFSRTVTLDELKVDAVFSDLPFIQKGNRLSVIEISRAQYQAICRLAKTKK
jgi:predicted RNA-binding protein with PUA-like domain